MAPPTITTHLNIVIKILQKQYHINIIGCEKVHSLKPEHIHPMKYFRHPTCHMFNRKLHQFLEDCGKKNSKFSSCLFSLILTDEVSLKVQHGHANYRLKGNKLNENKILTWDGMTLLNGFPRVPVEKYRSLKTYLNYI